jgi:predicted dehydrogenase
MTRKQILRAAMIGLRHGHMGSIGPEKPGYIQTFKGLDDVEVVAYFEDAEPERLAPAATEDPGANTYTNLDELIANEDFDVAMVGLPANEVPAAGIKLADAGKHFYMEKQFARNADDLAELARAVKRTGVKVFPGYPRRFHPVTKRLRSIIDQGLLGKPLTIETRLTTSQVAPGSRDPAAFSYRDATQGGGIVHHLGGHDLEMMRSLVGEVKAVQAMVGRPVGHIEAPLEDVAMVALQYENGAFGTIHQGYLSPAGLAPDSHRYLAYRGTDGWAEWTSQAPYVLKAGSTSPEWSDAPVREFAYTPAPYVGYGDDDWFHDYIHDFMEAIRNDREPALGVEDALAVARVIDAIYESSRSGRRVEVEYGL